MDAQIYGDRVRSARILRGTKSGSLAVEMGWPPSRQTKLEQAEIATVDVEVRYKLSCALKFPEEYFTTPPSIRPTAGELLFRAPVSTSKGEKNYLAEFAGAAGEFLEWIDGYHRLPPVRLPFFPANTPISYAAGKVRESLGVEDDQPIGNLTHRVERAGVPIIMRRQLSENRLAEADPKPAEKHIGYSTRVGKHRDRPITILRALNSWERIRWTTSHEVGHHVLHSAMLPENAEDEASRFASELLAPAAFLREQIPRNVTLAALTELKLHWGISIGALIPHLYDNGLISKERRDTLRNQLYTRINPKTGRTWGRDEPGYDSQIAERPSMLMTWVERCLGGTAPNMVAAMSRIWPADIVAMMMMSESRGRVSLQPHSSSQHRTNRSGVTDLNAWRAREALTVRVDGLVESAPLTNV